MEELERPPSDELQEPVEPPKGHPDIIAGMNAGFFVSIAAGAAWALVAIATGVELAFVATIIGALTGAVVSRAARDRGRSVRVIAISWSMIGILVGKYLIFVHAVRALLLSNGMIGDAARAHWFSTKLASFFFRHLPEMMSGFDPVWIGLAAIAAWRVVHNGSVRSLVRRRPRPSWMTKELHLRRPKPASE